MMMRIRLCHSMGCRSSEAQTTCKSLSRISQFSDTRHPLMVLTGINLSRHAYLPSCISELRAFLLLSCLDESVALEGEGDRIGFVILMLSNQSSSDMLYHSKP